jgi:hypothetical protein
MGDDKQPTSLEELRSHKRRNRVVVTAGCLLLAVLLVRPVADAVLAQGGDNDPKFVGILNQTDEKLTILRDQRWAKESPAVHSSPNGLEGYSPNVLLPD